LQLKIKCLDFTPFEEGERRGSLDERHRERVRSVDQLVEEWEGTGPGPAPGMGKDWGQLSNVSIQTQNRHDAFSELMATLIVPELIYFYIPLGLDSL
jgi:hypothetical protein